MLDGNLLSCVALKRNISVGTRYESVCCLFLIDSFPAFVMKAYISHLCCLGQTRAFSHVYYKDRKMRLRLATPPYNILGSYGNFPKKDAFPWSLWSLVTCASSLCRSKLYVLKRSGTVWAVHRWFSDTVFWAQWTLRKCLNSDLITKHLQHANQDIDKTPRVPSTSVGSRESADDSLK